MGLGFWWSTRMLSEAKIHDEGSLSCLGEDWLVVGREAGLAVFGMALRWSLRR